MDYRKFMSGDELLDYFDVNLKRGLTLKIAGGLSDYVEINFNDNSNLYTIDYIEATVPYICAYDLSKTLMEALIIFSNGQDSDNIFDGYLEISWGDY